MEKVVIYSKEMEFYLNDLIDILFYNDYFSYKENAENYVLKLKNEIESVISLKKHWTAPKKFQNYGKKYIVVSITQRTSWFVFFDQKANRYLIQYITNNHVEESKELHSNP